MTMTVLGGGGVFHQIFGNRIQHVIQNWTQSDPRFCKNEGKKDLRSMKKGISWIENHGENSYKKLKNC